MKYLYARACGKTARLTSALALAAITFWGCNTIAFAQSAGYDLFQTGSGASVDLSSIGLGVVNLNGVPIQTSTGNTDTIMQRTQDVPAGGGNVPVNLYALYLKSASPVSYKGQSADVYITVNNTGTDIPQTVLPQVDSLSPSTGSLTVRTDGTFDSTITVNADCILVRAGGSPTNSGDIIGHQAAPAISLDSSNSTWSSTPPDGYPAPSNVGGLATSRCCGSGKFYPKPKHKGPHPVIPGSCWGPNTYAATHPNSPKSGLVARQVCLSEVQSIAFGN